MTLLVKFKHGIVIVSAFVVAAALLGLLWSNVTQADVIKSQTQLISTLSSDSSALRDQLIENGERPVAPPPEVRAGEQGSPGPVGATGLAGRDGKDGEDGAPGTDGQPSTVPGPAGADSTVPGPAGANGADGQPGQPPFSWTYTDALMIEHTCTRTVPFDPAAPTYQCT